MERFDVEAGVREINAHLRARGFTERDADGADFQAGEDRGLRFKTGTVYGEVTVTVWFNDRQGKEPIRILGEHQMPLAKAQIDRLIRAHQNMEDHDA